MQLARALRLRAGQVVTFTGAGGKTTALHRLAQELGPAIPLLVTTTTRFGVDQLSLAAHHQIVREAPKAHEITDLLSEHGTVVMTGTKAESGAKWEGLPAAWVDDLKEDVSAVGGCLLVEGDGARRRLLKAPAEHEPVVPVSTDLLIPLLGAEAIGARLTEGVAHRPERVAAVTGCPLGERLQWGHVVELLTSAEGALKGRPESARVRVLLNGPQAPAPTEVIDRISAETLERDRSIDALISADLGAADPVGEVRARTAGVVLAAGGSKRMAGLKQLREWRGRPLVSWALKAAEEAGLGPLFLVVGEGAEQVQAAGAAHRVTALHNPDWTSGQSSSLRVGLRAAMAANVEAVVFLLADMPLVDEGLLARLVERHRSTLSPIVAPWAGNRWGNPVLFDRVTYEALLAVKGDRGGRALFDQFEMEPVAAGRGALIDVDTEGDWKRLE